MTREEILLTAKGYITKDRAATHGDAENNFATIAHYWNVYLKDKPLISSFDVAMMMALFKVARVQSNNSHIDSYIDACGYMAIAGELGAKCA